MAAIPLSGRRDGGLEQDPPPENSMERTGRNSGFSAEPTGLPLEDAGNWKGLLGRSWSRGPDKVATDCKDKVMLQGGTEPLA